MNTLKTKTISACALFIMLGLVVSGISNLYNTKGEENTSAENATEAVVTSASVADEDDIDPKYVLKIQDGIVVVYGENDLTRPIIVTDIYAGSLRHFDKAALTEGVMANNYTEMQCMLEDYSS